MALVRGSTGQVVARYSYDAWGKCTVTNASGYTVGTKNPFRYRGYYHDTETGLYYLNSRYYNPEFGRFISPDVFVSTGQGLTGANMFAYCGNNPVNLIDRYGRNATEAAAAWGSTMWWLPAIDGPIPVGDGIYFLGIGIIFIGSCLLFDSTTSDADLSKSYIQSNSVSSGATIGYGSAATPPLNPKNNQNKNKDPIKRSWQKVNEKFLKWEFLKKQPESLLK